MKLYLIDLEIRINQNKASDEARYTDRMAMTHEVSDAGHRGRAEQPHNAPGPGRGQQRLVSVRVVTPGAGVEILLGIRISVTLEQLDVIILKNWPIITHINPQSPGCYLLTRL